MEDNKTIAFLRDVLANIPNDWLRLTTHRLDIYDEKRAKIQFIEQFEALFQEGKSGTSDLAQLSTAYDYIRLGHPLSCVLEWAIARMHHAKTEQVISFSSATMPVFAVLRENKLNGKKTRILCSGELPTAFDAEILRMVYGYDFEVQQVAKGSAIAAYAGSTILFSQTADVCHFDLQPAVDFFVNAHPQLGSVVLVNKEENAAYVSRIQHVRRRETIAMTPADALTALKALTEGTAVADGQSDNAENKAHVLASIAEITGTPTTALVASSGLSMQYAIVMGLIHHARDAHSGKDIKVVVPPNCYGGTNDQARRVAASTDGVEVMDLPVDGDHDMVQSVELVLEEIAKQDAVPFIIAEIPTNPRVEVPDLLALKAALSKARTTTKGTPAVPPVFILDQTFCPNTPFLGEADVLSPVQTIAYVSGSKFPSGGKCTAGYCTTNQKAAALMDKIALHLSLCDNEATGLQYEILAKQMPSMIQRIQDAYQNTRAFVNFIQETLPAAKINFVSEALAAQGFTPSVFSLDLPTKGNTDAEREAYKRKLNLKLIELMITELPQESKYCVSYGQLKGCYWTIPATSTQGTTKEGDKDYIARVAVSPDLDLERHKEVFLEFVKGI